MWLVWPRETFDVNKERNSRWFAFKVSLESSQSVIKDLNISNFKRIYSYLHKKSKRPKLHQWSQIFLEHTVIKIFLFCGIEFIYLSNALVWTLFIFKLTFGFFLLVFDYVIMCELSLSRSDKIVKPAFWTEIFLIVYVLALFIEEGHQVN
jgi:hypothetical protein